MWENLDKMLLGKWKMFQCQASSSTKSYITGNLTISIEKVIIEFIDSNTFIARLLHIEYTQWKVVVWWWKSNFFIFRFQNWINYDLMINWFASWTSNCLSSFLALNRTSLSILWMDCLFSVTTLLLRTLYSFIARALCDFVTIFPSGRMRACP